MQSHYMFFLIFIEYYIKNPKCGLSITLYLRFLTLNLEL